MLPKFWFRAVCVLSVAVTACLGQVADSPRPHVPLGASLPEGAPDAPIGPWVGLLPPPPTPGQDRQMMSPGESVLAQLDNRSEGGDPRTGGGEAGDGVTQYVDQPYACDVYYFSNSNHNTSPYIVCDDFVADGTPLTNIRFFGGSTVDFATDVSRVGIEIWTTQPGGGCGWTYDQFVAAEFFTRAELAPVQACGIGNERYQLYDLRATFSSPIPLVAGQRYFITIYGELNNPNQPGLFFVARSTVANGNLSESLNRISRQYDRCGPYDMAFETNPPQDCFEIDCDRNWSAYSNDTNPLVPFISFDDFVAQETVDLRRLRFEGCAFNFCTREPASLANIEGFYIQLFTVEPEAGSDCLQNLTSYINEYWVPIADARPMFRCVDSFGLINYTFTVDLPPGVFPLTALERYSLAVFATRYDSDGCELFAWDSAGKPFGLINRVWNYDRFEAYCTFADMAFCINPPPPCLGDFNHDGAANTLDVLAFLNAWAADQLAADCNADGIINTQDVLCFLNRWAGGCP